MIGGINMIKLKSLIISLVVSLGVGFLASLATRESMGVYQYINLPPFAPPSSVFPIVWTILYVLMGISSYMVYETDSKYKSSALTLYAVQLVVNFIWPLLFFNGKMFSAAFICLIILWLLVIFMIIQFYKVKPWAAWLQIPYLLWLTFAAFLNWNVFILNR